MSGGHVLVIADDEWVARLLAVGLREAGHRVTLCADGAGGITTIHREVPDCVVCDVELPDIDGFAIGRSMRQAGGRVAGTPLVFLCAREEGPETKMEALRAGGDAFLSKPFRIDEVALTVTALIRLAERNRGIAPAPPPMNQPSIIPVRPPTPTPPPPRPPEDRPDGVLEGDLSKVSVATVLTVLEMEKHTGMLEMVRGDRQAKLHLESGNVDGAHLGDTPAEPIDVLRTVLTWTGGRFTFIPSKKPERLMTGRATIGALLMEAARLEDEFRAGMPGPERPSQSSLPPFSSRVSELVGAAFSSGPPIATERYEGDDVGREGPSSTMNLAALLPPDSVRDPLPAEPAGGGDGSSLGTASLLEDGWDLEEDAPVSIRPAEVEPMRPGPPPVPPPRKATIAPEADEVPPRQVGDKR